MTDILEPITDDRLAEIIADIRNAMSNNDCPDVATLGTIDLLSMAMELQDYRESVRSWSKFMLGFQAEVTASCAALVTEVRKYRCRPCWVCEGTGQYLGETCLACSKEA